MAWRTFRHSRLAPKWRSKTKNLTAQPAVSLNEPGRAGACGFPVQRAGGRPSAGVCFYKMKVCRVGRARSMEESSNGETGCGNRDGRLLPPFTHMEAIRKTLPTRKSCSVSCVAAGDAGFP